MTQKWWGVGGKGYETDEFKHWLSTASYEELLRKWRFVSPSDPILQGEYGVLFKERLLAVMSALDSEERIAVSKKVGFPERFL